MPTLTYEALTDAELLAMRDRAWKQAARELAEVRIAKRDGEGAELIRILSESADGADAFWRSLRDAAKARGLTA